MGLWSDFSQILVVVYLDCALQLQTNYYLRGHFTILGLVIGHICLSNQEKLIVIDRLDAQRPIYPS